MNSVSSKTSTWEIVALVDVEYSVKISLIVTFKESVVDMFLVSLQILASDKIVHFE